MGLRILTAAGLPALVAVLVPATAGAGHGGSPSGELNFVGELDLGLPGENVTDVWAYDDCAYLGTFDDIQCSLDDTGVHIVDISDPANPAKAAFIPAKPGTRNNDVKVDHIDAGLVMLDITDPANPTFMGDSVYGIPDPLSGQFPRRGRPRGRPQRRRNPRALRRRGHYRRCADDIHVRWSDALDGWRGLHDRRLRSASQCWRDLSHPAWHLLLLDQRGQRSDIGLGRFHRGQRCRTRRCAGPDVRGHRGCHHHPGVLRGQHRRRDDEGVRGCTLAADGIFDGYGYLRLLDTSDPSNIVEVDQFATEGVFVNPPLSGDRTMHNVVVDGGTPAYISWYDEGIRVVDFSGDTLTEVAHYTESADGGANFWGVYLHEVNGTTYVLVS